MQLTQRELLDWVDLLYTDLCKDSCYIGGYFFNFDALPDFLILKQDIERYTLSIKDKIDKLTSDTSKSECKAVQAEINKLSKDLNEVRVELFCKDKFDKAVNVPCTIDEFNVVFDTLLEFKKDVEYFKQYCMEEAKKLDDDDIANFMWFLTDMVKDMRDRFKGLELSK